MSFVIASDSIVMERERFLGIDWIAKDGVIGNLNDVDVSSLPEGEYYVVGGGGDYLAEVRATTQCNCPPCTTCMEFEDGSWDCAPTGGPGCESYEVSCDNSDDDDGDGDVDCADDDCAGDPYCEGEDPCVDDPNLCGSSEICWDIDDNDGDGRIDCADDDCVGDYFCRGNECGTADDCGGANPYCQWGLLHQNICDRGICNVSRIDCGNSNPPQECSEGRCVNKENCWDLRDNDGDGRIDCVDDDCFDYIDCNYHECGNADDCGLRNPSCQGNVLVENACWTGKCIISRYNCDEDHFICRDGRCVINRCTIDSECPTNKVCENGACVGKECITVEDCGGRDEMCIIDYSLDEDYTQFNECGPNGRCIVGNYYCPSNSFCRDGECVWGECTTVEDCGGRNYVCMGDTLLQYNECGYNRRCITTDYYCPTGQVCWNMECVSEENNGEDGGEGEDDGDSNGEVSVIGNFNGTGGKTASIRNVYSSVPGGLIAEITFGTSRSLMWIGSVTDNNPFMTEYISEGGVIVGDFDKDNKDELMLLQKDSSYVFIYGYVSGKGFEYEFSGPLYFADCTSIGNWTKCLFNTDWAEKVYVGDFIEGDGIDDLMMFIRMPVTGEKDYYHAYIWKGSSTQSGISKIEPIAKYSFPLANSVGAHIPINLIEEWGPYDRFLVGDANANGVADLTAFQPVDETQAYSYVWENGGLIWDGWLYSDALALSPIEESWKDWKFWPWNWF